METPNEPAAEAAVPAAIDEREAILAEMEALTEDVVPSDAEETPAAQQAKELETDEAEAEPAPTETPEDVTEPEPEPEVSLDDKKLAALQRAEKKQQEAAQARASELEAREAALAEREDVIKRYEAAKARAAVDPVGVLEELGLTPDQFEETARDFYNRRPGADVDRVTAQRNLKVREANSAAAKALEEVKELKAQLQHAEDRRIVQQRFDTYINKTVEAIGADTPIVAKLHANNPNKFRSEVDLTAARLWEETGETPDHVDVLQELENTKRAELLELGFELPKGSQTKQPAQASQKPVGKTLTNDLGTPTKPRTEPLTEEEERADVLKGMAQLD
jgi:hypothetical protein